MKSFIVRVLVGEFTGEGEGKSKKIAKKLAAAAALSELKKLPPIPCVERNLPRIKKKTKSIIKVIGPGLGPDSSLIIKTLFSNLPTFTAADQPGVRTGHEPHQPSGPDPAGQEGEGAGLQYGDGEGSAAAQRVRHAGQTSALRFIWIFFFGLSGECCFSRAAGECLWQVCRRDGTQQEGGQEERRREDAGPPGI